MSELPEAVSRLLGAAGEPGFLGPHHAEAARRITRSFARARLRQRVTMSYDPTRIGERGSGNAQADLAAGAEGARQYLSRLAAQLPRDCWGVLCDVCIYDKGLQQIEAERNWPRRSAKLVLRIGLEQLARAFGLDAAAVGRTAGDMRTWLPERPAMFAEPER
ncbi:DUF6456 domain-containing protein [Devosia sp. XK-2]|uniref:DUF6456 domain-containing protein n=1 Tax=Devosia sp. XK-2 TaxID=3126689 RepID=UPI0030D3145B